jgi:ParB family chromosome partitioning protein
MLDEDLSVCSRGADPTTVEGAATFESNTKDVALSGIAVPSDRLRSLQPKVVDGIAKSFEEVGQLQSIVIRSAAGSGNAAYYLVSGRHRLEAARKLGWGSIRALVVEGFDADRAQLAEIDENLIRADLGPAELSAHLKTRKDIFERLHPETKQGGAPGKAGGGKKAKNDKLSSFATDTAAKTGQNKRTVERGVARAKSIPNISELAGTSLDQGGELDALAKLAADQQAVLVAKAKAGKKVSAKPSKAVKAERKEKHKEKAEEDQAQDGTRQEETTKAGDEPAHPAIAYLREHLSVEQIAEFFTLVERPNYPGCWNEFGEALAGEPEIRKLLEEREAAPASNDEQEQAASVGQEEAPCAAA